MKSDFNCFQISSIVELVSNDQIYYSVQNSITNCYKICCSCHMSVLRYIYIYIYNYFEYNIFLLTILIFLLVREEEKQVDKTKDQEKKTTTDAPSGMHSNLFYMGAWIPEMCECLQFEVLL